MYGLPLRILSGHKETFGYAPAYTVNAGLEETIEWFREQEQS
jgi:nucleoside-diphosphate-sugar epimerase